MGKNLLKESSEKGFDYEQEFKLEAKDFKSLFKLSGLIFD